MKITVSILSIICFVLSAIGQTDNSMYMTGQKGRAIKFKNSSLVTAVRTGDSVQLNVDTVNYINSKYNVYQDSLILAGSTNLAKYFAGLSSYQGSDLASLATKGIIAANPAMQEVINSVVYEGDSVVEGWVSSTEDNSWTAILSNYVAGGFGDGFIRQARTNFNDDTRYSGFTYTGSGVSQGTHGPTNATRTLGTTGALIYTPSKIFKYVDVVLYNTSSCILTFALNGVVYRTKVMPAGNAVYSFDGTQTGSTSISDVYTITCTSGNTEIAAFYHFNDIAQLGNITVQSSARAGYNSADLVSNLPYLTTQYSLLANQPVTFLCMIGLNDMINSGKYLSPIAYAANLQTIITAHNAVPKSSFVFIFPYQPNLTNTNEAYSIYHDSAQAVCLRNRKNFIDGSKFNVITTNYTADNLHLNNAGSAAFAVFIAQQLALNTSYASVSGGLSGLTSGNYPVSTSATTIGNSSLNQVGSVLSYKFNDANFANISMINSNSTKYNNDFRIGMGTSTTSITSWRDRGVVSSAYGLVLDGYTDSIFFQTSQITRAGVSNNGLFGALSTVASSSNYVGNNIGNTLNQYSNASLIYGVAGQSCGWPSLTNSAFLFANYRLSLESYTADINFETNFISRMGIAQNGAVTINSLAGNGTGIVAVNNAGIVSWQATPTTTLTFPTGLATDSLVTELNGATRKIAPISFYIPLKKLDKVLATTGQTAFTITFLPLGDVAMHHNGVLVDTGLYTVSGKNITYTQTEFAAGDNVTFDYIHQ